MVRSKLNKFEHVWECCMVRVEGEGAETGMGTCVVRASPIPS